MEFDPSFGSPTDADLSKVPKKKLNLPDREPSSRCVKDHVGAFSIETQ